MVSLEPVCLGGVAGRWLASFFFKSVEGFLRWLLVDLPELPFSPIFSDCFEAPAEDILGFEELPGEDMSNNEIDRSL